MQWQYWYFKTINKNNEVQRTLEVDDQNNSLVNYIKKNNIYLVKKIRIPDICIHFLKILILLLPFLKGNIRKNNNSIYTLGEHMTKNDDLIQCLNKTIDHSSSLYIKMVLKKIKLLVYSGMPLKEIMKYLINKTFPNISTYLLNYSDQKKLGENLILLGKTKSFEKTYLFLLLGKNINLIIVVIFSLFLSQIFAKYFVLDVIYGLYITDQKIPKLLIAYYNIFYMNFYLYIIYFIFFSCLLYFFIKLCFSPLKTMFSFLFVILRKTNTYVKTNIKIKILSEITLLLTMHSTLQYAIKEAINVNSIWFSNKRIKIFYSIIEETGSIYYALKKLNFLTSNELNNWINTINSRNIMFSIENLKKTEQNKLIKYKIILTSAVKISLYTIILLITLFAASVYIIGYRSVIYYD